jgi:Alternative oxidase
MALAARPTLSPADALHATPPKLTAVELRVAEVDTMRGPRLRYDVVSRLLFGFIHLVYGRAGNLRKFRALELLARVPYHAWERAAYRAAGRLSHRTALASTVHRRIMQSRAQQDNEQWHLFVLDEVIQARGERLRWFRDRVLPRLLAGVYHPLIWLVLLVSPAYSYRLNAAFEDHAEHEYMAFVAQHPHLDRVRFASHLGDVFDHVDTLADLLRQIGHDERVHKLESLREAALAAAVGSPS